MSDSKNPFSWKQTKATIPSLTEELTALLLRGKRVLFLDDDQNLGELVQRVAENYKLELVQVTTSNGAGELLKNGPPFDAAILDINVVNGNGIVLYRWLLEEFPKMQVIFLTGLAVEEASERVHAVGSAPVYSKPTLWKPGFFEDMLEKLGCRKKIVV